MKKTILALSFAVAIMSLAACNSGKKSSNMEDTTSVQATQPATTAAPADSTANMKMDSTKADTTKMK